MRVRTIELRILAAALVGLWISTFALILIGYRPGGPIDLAVGAALVGPILIAALAVWAPPVARGDRAFAAIAWLGLGAVLLLVPSLVGLATQLARRGPQTLLPSMEAAYPWLLALVATSLFAGLGVARRRLGETALRRRRLVLGSLLATGFVLIAGSTFAMAAVVNELALGDRPSQTSRFGPTDPAIEPPPCSDPIAVGASARLELRMDSTVGDRRTGQMVVDGIRNGGDIRWSGYVASRLTLGQRGLARVGDQAWVLGGTGSWTAAPLDRTLGRDLDRQLVAVALTPGVRAAAEDGGLAFVEGARARHCRVKFDGAALRRSLPMVDLLIGDTDISRWQGDLDVWVFADGQLGQADGEVSGPASDLADDALTATIRFRLTAVDRGLAISIPRPAR